MKVYFLASVLLFVSLLKNETYAQSTSRLQSIIQGIDQDPDMASASWGFCVKDVRSGKLLASFQHNKSLVTASVMKAVTTATALHILGSSFQYKTELGYEGKISPDGTLEGNIICKGGGDPTLGSDRFPQNLNAEVLVKKWGDIIQQRGIKVVKGDLIADVSVFGSQLTPDNWSWEDMGNYYGAGSHGINFHENLYYLDFRSEALPGSPTQVLRTRPPVGGMTFTNEVVAGPRGSGDNAYIYGSPYSYHRYIRGSIPPGREVFTIKGSLPNPGIFLLERLRLYLQTCGIQLQGKLHLQTSPRSYASFSLLDRHLSPTLADIAQETNYESVNLFAETLVKSMAVQQKKAGNTDEGLEVITDFWEDRGIATKGMILRDGSGLSPNNVLTPHQITEILRLTYLSPVGKDFYRSLPVAGQSGTVKGILRGSKAQGKIHMKSGYISRVRSYAGFVESRSGNLWVFSMSSNNYTCSAGRMRRLLERLMLAMVDM